MEAAWSARSCEAHPASLGKGSTRPRAEHGLRLTPFIIAGICLVVALWSAQSAAAQAFTWSGSAAPGTPQWSEGSNWSGGVAPNGTVGSLTLPALSSPECTAAPPTATCYSSTNDVVGLSASSMSLSAGAKYTLFGEGLSLGAGGLTAAVTQSNLIALPISLAADQSWAISGTGSAAAFPSLTFTGNISGNHTLGLQLSDRAAMTLSNDTELGAVSVHGAAPAPPAPAQPAPNLVGVSGKLNATSGGTIAVTGNTDLVSLNAQFGPLSMSGRLFQVGGGTPATADVAGNLSVAAGTQVLFFLAGTGTTAGTDYSQLRATGNVSLDGADLSLLFPNGSCPTFTPGSTFDIVTATGSISGTFAGLPEGALINPYCGPLFQLHYTAHAVTVTALAKATTTTTLSSAPASPAPNLAVTLTATITASKGTPTGKVAFAFKNGGPIPGCTAQLVIKVGAVYQATCDTTLARSSMPPSGAVTAAFTPVDTSAYLGSSTELALNVGRGATTTTLETSAANTVAVGTAPLLKATVAAGILGPLTPTGTVTFFDGATPIAGCTDEPLDPDFLTASCIPQPPGFAAGTHEITVKYSGSTDFDPSTSAALTITATSGDANTTGGTPPDQPKVTPTGTGNPPPPVTPPAAMTAAGARGLVISALAKKFKKTWSKSRSRKVTCTPAAQTATCRIAFRYRSKRYAGTAQVTDNGARIRLKVKKR